MPVNTIAMPASSAAAITSASRMRAAGLDHRGGARLGRGEQAVGEGEEGVGGDDRAPGRGSGSPRGLARFLRLPGGDARGIDPAHLPGADADGGPVLGIDDGVRLHMLGDGEGEQQVGRSRASLGARLVTTFRSRREPAVVAALQQEAAGRALRLRPGAAGSGRPPAASTRRFFFAASSSRRRRLDRGRDHHLGEQLGDRVGRRRVERPVDGDDAAEGADGIAGQRPAIGRRRGRGRGRRRRDWRA